jgi:hypothetical protein
VQVAHEFEGGFEPDEDDVVPRPIELQVREIGA